MNNYFINSVKQNILKLISISLCLLLFNILKAQNTSYNANTIPITGAGNTAFGFQTLFSNTTGVQNTVTGVYAMDSNTTGLYNTANGAFALYSNTTGSFITAIGGAALQNNKTGLQNTAVGNLALLYNISGYQNTALGDSAGFKSTGNGNVFIGYGAGAIEKGNNKMYIGNDSARTLLYGDFSTGQILLGKPDATGYIFKGNRTLNVLGGIIADSITVALSGNWADYVFNKDYPLKPLNELESYIIINKHLPEIPTSNDIKNNGINVASMDASLLKKIEELTLYIIELKKESLQQQEEIDKLKRK